MTISERAARMFLLMPVHPGPDMTVAAAASLAGLPRSEARLALLELYGEQLVAMRAAERNFRRDLPPLPGARDRPRSGRLPGSACRGAPPYLPLPAHR